VCLKQAAPWPSRLRRRSTPWSAALSVDTTTTVAESVDTVARAIEEIWE
jgi:hypothetical protein